MRSRLVAQRRRCRHAMVKPLGANLPASIRVGDKGRKQWGGWRSGSSKRQSGARLSRSALAMTLTDDSAIAAAAMTGDSSTPSTG